MSLFRKTEKSDTSSMTKSQRVMLVVGRVLKAVFIGIMVFTVALTCLTWFFSSCSDSKVEEASAASIPSELSSSFVLSPSGFFSVDESGVPLAEFSSAEWPYGDSSSISEAHLTVNGFINRNGFLVPSLNLDVWSRMEVWLQVALFDLSLSAAATAAPVSTGVYKCLLSDFLPADLFLGTGGVLIYGRTSGVFINETYLRAAFLGTSWQSDSTVRGYRYGLQFERCFVGWNYYIMDPLKHSGLRVIDTTSAGTSYGQIGGDTFAFGACQVAGLGSSGGGSIQVPPGSSGGGSIQVPPYIPSDYPNAYVISDGQSFYTLSEYDQGVTYTFAVDSMVASAYGVMLAQEEPVQTIYAPFVFSDDNSLSSVNGYVAETIAWTGSQEYKPPNYSEGATVPAHSLVMTFSRDAGGGIQRGWLVGSFDLKDTGELVCTVTTYQLAFETSVSGHLQSISAFDVLASIDPQYEYLYPFAELIYGWIQGALQWSAFPGGYSAGYDTGYDAGYGAGHTDGHEEGYHEGYVAGLAETDPFSWARFMTVVDQFLDYEFFGFFSLGDLLVVAIGGYFFLLFLKVFAGG